MREWYQSKKEEVPHAERIENVQNTIHGIRCVLKYRHEKAAWVAWKLWLHELKTKDWVVDPITGKIEKKEKEGVDQTIPDDLLKVEYPAKRKGWWHPYFKNKLRTAPRPCAPDWGQTIIKKRKAKDAPKFRSQEKVRSTADLLREGSRAKLRGPPDPRRYGKRPRRVKRVEKGPNFAKL
jgi:hypothetical protein